jgi:hypothetical protein
MLLRSLAGDAVADIVLEDEPELVIRASTAPPRDHPTVIAGLDPAIQGSHLGAPTRNAARADGSPGRARR